MTCGCCAASESPATGAPAWISLRCNQSGCGIWPSGGAAGACRGIGLGQLRKDRIAIVRFSRFTPGLANSAGPGTLDRAALEAYLARLAVEIAHPKTRSTDIGAVTGFPARRAPAPVGVAARGRAALSQRPARRDQTPAPRVIPEFVMHQLESPANLDRISDPRIRLLVGILIRTGLRIGMPPGWPWTV